MSSALALKMTEGSLKEVSPYILNLFEMFRGDTGDSYIPFFTSKTSILIVVERAKRAKPLSTLVEFTPLLLSHIALLRRYKGPKNKSIFVVLYFSNTKLQKISQSLWYYTSVILGSRKEGNLCEPHR